MFWGDLSPSSPHNYATDAYILHLISYLDLGYEDRRHIGHEQ